MASSSGGGINPGTDPGNGTIPKQNKTYDVFEYDKNDVGPYRLIAELIDNKSGEVRINKLSLGKLLCRSEEYKQNVTNMRPMGANKLLVFVKSYLTANKLQQDGSLKEENYKFYVPRSFVSITGVIAGVPTDMSTEEIQENMTCKVPILNVYRLHRYVNGQKLPSNRVSVTFRSNTLPEEVKMYCCINKVNPFVSKPVLCQNCLRYGHKTESCRGKKRCMVCSMQHDGMDQGDCPNRQKCMHCRSETDHRTTDVNCPEYKRQRNIKVIMARSNLTYLEARDANPIFTQNRYELLENSADFPTPVESFSRVAAGSYKTKDPNQYKPQKQKRAIQEVNIADSVQVFRDQKKKKTDKEPEARGVALFNKYRVSDFDRWAHIIEKQRQQDLNRNGSPVDSGNLTGKVDDIRQHNTNPPESVASLPDSMDSTYEDFLEDISN